MSEFNIAVGRKIKELRNRAGMSQVHLANKLSISRSMLSLFETGKQPLSAEEAETLSKIFFVSLDTLLSKESTIALETPKPKEEKESDIRISVPQEKWEKFREVFLYILNKVGSKPNIGETVIYKLLYFIDFDFYEKYEEQLIGAAYIRNQFGPTPREFRKIVDKMIEEGDVIQIQGDYYKHLQRKYLPLREPNLAIFKANEIELIDNVLNRLSWMNASQISEYSHGDIPWLATQDGKVIDYESVFYRTATYSVVEYDENIQ